MKYREGTTEPALAAGTNLRTAKIRPPVRRGSPCVPVYLCTGRSHCHTPVLSRETRGLHSARLTSSFRRRAPARRVGGNGRYLRFAGGSFIFHLLVPGVMVIGIQAGLCYKITHYRHLSLCGRTIDFQLQVNYSTLFNALLMDHRNVSCV